MESRKRIPDLQERRIARQFDKLEAILKTLPPDRIQALQEDVLMNATGKDRQARHSDKQRSLGRIRPNWWIDVDTVNEIRKRAAATGGNVQDAVNTVLRELLEQQKSAPPTPAVTKPKATTLPPVPATPVLISATETAKRLQVSVHELNRWHRERRGPQPRYVKRRWLYDERELDEWLAAERRKAEEDTAL